jgi:hypothetical protein
MTVIAIDIDNPILNINEFENAQKTLAKSQSFTLNRIHLVALFPLSYGLFSQYLPNLSLFVLLPVLALLLGLLIYRYNKLKLVNPTSPITICGEALFYQREGNDSLTRPLHKSAVRALHQKQDAKVQVYLQKVLPQRPLVLLDEVIIDHYLMKIQN